MERPFCPLCKTNHFAREPHAFEKNTRGEGRRVLKAEGVSSDATRTAATAKARPATANLGKTAGEKGNAEKPAAGNRKTAPKFDRTAYQREYMRGWRKRKAGVS